jgi:hypothetical protein
MILKVFLDDQTYPIEVPDYIVSDAEEFFSFLDSDMNKGWQMSQFWVDSPDINQRCQIAADKLLTALNNDDQKTGVMMSAYIMNRMPGTTELHLSITGDMNEHVPVELVYTECAETKGEALRREIQIKQMSPKQKRDLVKTA